MPDALLEDTITYPTLIELAACLCLEMQASGGPALCYCGPVAGEVVMDYCGNGSCGEGGCGGQAWVRFENAFPSSTFPGQDQALGNCRAPLAFSLEIGVARCAPVGENNGAGGFTPPTLQQNVDALRLQLADMAAMRRAVQCCFGKGDRDYILGAYTQASVNGGGCIGGTFSVQVWEAF
jgi:hypothetical protein